MLKIIFSKNIIFYVIPEIIRIHMFQLQINNSDF